VHQFRLGFGHPGDPITARDLAARGELDPRGRRLRGHRHRLDQRVHAEDSHGSGRTACRHRAIPDFPELEPPLSTITCVATAPT